MEIDLQHFCRNIIKSWKTNLKADRSATLLTFDYAKKSVVYAEDNYTTNLLMMD
jgi:hypothetical protein